MTVAEVLQKAIDRTHGEVKDLLVTIRNNLLVSQISKRASLAIINFLVAGTDDVSEQAFSVLYDILYGGGSHAN